MSSKRNKDIALENLLDHEKPIIETVNMINNPDVPQSTIKSEITDLNIARDESMREHFTMLEFKTRQIQDYANNYAISQVEPSRWSVLFNIINTIFLTIALAIGFLVAFGLLFGLSPQVVMSGSMSPTIPAGSLAIVKPLSGPNELSVGDIVSYQYVDNGKTNTYLHRLKSIIVNSDPNNSILTLVGDNPETADKSHTVAYQNVKGKLVLSIPGIGSVILWIKNNLWLTIALMMTLIIGLVLTRMLIEQNHARANITSYLVKKAEYEKNAERKYKEELALREKREFDKIMNTDFSKNKKQENIDK